MDEREKDEIRIEIGDEKKNEEKIVKKIKIIEGKKS